MSKVQGSIASRITSLQKLMIEILYVGHCLNYIISILMTSFRYYKAVG